MFDLFGTDKRKQAFTMTTKKTEWMKAVGRDPDGKFYKTSKCRKCGIKLTWGDRRYNFDHKDNNPANNSQRNCYLVCRNCHGAATKIEKQKVRGLFGEVIGHKTVKRKVSYKKPKKSKTKAAVKKKKKAADDFWGFLISSPPQSSD